MRVSRAGRRDRGKAGLLPRQAKPAGQGAQGGLIDLRAARTRTSRLRSPRTSPRSKQLHRPEGLSATEIKREERTMKRLA